MPARPCTPNPASWEIHFGKLSNLEAHEPIIDRDVWRAVQRVKVSRGRQAKSERLLARLGILRCGTCGGPMSVSNSERASPIYRCSPLSDCGRRMAISAKIAETVVVNAVKNELSDLKGRASAERDALAAANAADIAQSNLDAAIRAFTGLDAEEAAREKLAELRAIRDSAFAEAHRLSGLSASFTVNIGERWDDLTLDEKRTAIRLTISRAVVGPGRGPGRIRVELVREHPAGD